MPLYDGDMQKLLRRTANAIAAQPALPLSPGTMVNLQPELCAAAAMVHQAAGLSAVKPDMAQLARDMVVNGKDYILGLASRFGLSSDFVAELMRRNDSWSHGERRDRMLEFLQRRIGDAFSGRY